jgi:hypothetical protein
LSRLQLLRPRNEPYPEGIHLHMRRVLEKFDRQNAPDSCGGNVERIKLFMKNLIAQAKAFWASLPHQVQAAIIVFATVAGTTLGKEFQALAFGTANFTRSSLQHDVWAALVAGAFAAKAFYMTPSKNLDPTADAK